MQSVRTKPWARIAYWRFTAGSVVAHFKCRPSREFLPHDAVLVRWSADPKVSVRGVTVARGLSGRMPRVSSGAESHEGWGLEKKNSLKNGAFVHFTRVLRSRCLSQLHGPTVSKKSCRPIQLINHDLQLDHSRQRNNSSFIRHSWQRRKCAIRPAC